MIRPGGMLCALTISKISLKKVRLTSLIKPGVIVTDRFASIRQKWQSICNKYLSNISNLIRYRAGNFIIEISTKYQLAVQLTYPRHLFQPVICSHEAELNRENLGFCHSHDYYAFVYIRRFNSLIHCQFCFSSFRRSIVPDLFWSQMHLSLQIFFECAIRMLLHIPKFRGEGKSERWYRRWGKYKPPVQLEYASDHN